MVDVLDDSGLAQAGGFEAELEALVLTLDRLAIDHHGETLLEGERGDIGLAALVFERLAMPVSRVRSGDHGWDGSASFPPVLSGSSTAADVAVPDRRAFRWLPLAVGPVEDERDGASEKYLVLEAVLHRGLCLRTVRHRAPSQDGRAVAEPDRAARPSVARGPGWPVFRADSPPCGQCDGAAHP